MRKKCGKTRKNAENAEKCGKMRTAIPPPPGPRHGFCPLAAVERPLGIHPEEVNGAGQVQRLVEDDHLRPVRPNAPGLQQPRLELPEQRDLLQRLVPSGGGTTSKEYLLAPKYFSMSICSEKEHLQARLKYMR